MPVDKEPEVTHRTLRIPDFWKRWGTDKKIVVSSGPLPTPEQLPPAMPPEVQAEERRRLQTEAGVGSFAARTEAGMRRTEERAETIGSVQKKPKEDE